ncbi:MAG: DUF433 domain-containing protein [Okeania sp. SIO2C2]|uniref:DUF433 domain-containing protein n=1 Tax=Okeania sp. SIO2C2 TaxID=2607787 RepID=UPI0013B80007|nr:DUF433 domain-containing protein [Okeania sp. SIO2C2]NEP91259.1 DUF433 domain-containing protein [Okeania sp. SIO2C2]
MEITLDPELEKFIRNQVQSGQYASLDEAMNVALRILATQSLASQGINKTPNVCGGDACVGNTRIPVWSLVSDRLQVKSQKSKVKSKNGCIFVNYNQKSG